MDTKVISLFKYLPKTDCGECGLPTCLAFARKLARAEASAEECPYVAQTCPKCGHSQDTLFKECPSCGASLLEVRHANDREATTCPKCGYSSQDSFYECPNCGVSVGVISRQSRMASAQARMRSRDHTRTGGLTLEDTDVNIQTRPGEVPVDKTAQIPQAKEYWVSRENQENSSGPEQTRAPKAGSVSDMTSAPDASMDTEAYFKKKSSPTRHCPYCGFATQEDISECPQCGMTGEWETMG